MQALTVLEFLIKRGSDQCVENAQNLKVRLEDLQVFEYTSPDGRDHGVNVRHRYKPTSATLTCTLYLSCSCGLNVFGFGNYDGDQSQSMQYSQAVDEYA